MTHNDEEKTVKVIKSLFVGRSDHFDEVIDTMDETNDKNLIIRQIAGYLSAYFFFLPVVD